MSLLSQLLSGAMGLDGKKKLLVSGGSIATIASLTAASPEAEIFKYLAIAVVAGAHAFSQAYVDRGRVELATKTGQPYKPARKKAKNP